MANSPVIATNLVESLTRAIGSGEFEAGDPLVERQLGQRFGASRTPVREALKILEHQGLVFRVPGKGVFVAPVSTQDIEEVFLLREILETTAARLAAARIPLAEIQKIRDDLIRLEPEGPSEAYYETDRALHSLLVDYCGNRRLRDLLAAINVQIIRVRHTSALLPNRYQFSRQEHLDIVEALLARNTEQVVDRLRAHLANVKASALEVCRSNIRPAAGQSGVG